MKSLGIEGYERKKKKKHGPGVGSKVLYGLSLLERPAQALKVGIKESLDDDDDGLWEGMQAGWLGEDEVRGQDILFSDEYLKRHPILSGIGGFLFDVATDPLTYLGGYAFKAAAAGTKAGFKALPASAQAATKLTGRAIAEAPATQTLGRAFNVPMGKAKQVKASSMQALGKLQQNKNESDKLVLAYEKWANKKATALGLKGKEGRDKIDSAFRNYVERGGAAGAKGDDDAWANWLKHKDNYVDIGEDGWALARDHADEYERLLQFAKDQGIRIGDVTRQQDMFNPVYGYFHHAATPFARKAKGSDLGELTSSQGIMKTRSYKGATDDINKQRYDERMQSAWDDYLHLKIKALQETGEIPTKLSPEMTARLHANLRKEIDIDELKNHLGEKTFTKMGEQNMFHTNPAIAMGVYKRQIAQADQARWFKKEMLDPDRNMGLWFQKNPNRPTQMQVRASPYEEWRPATPSQVENYVDTDLSAFKSFASKEILDEEGKLIQSIPTGKTDATFMFPKEVADMVKERYAIMSGKTKGGDTWLKHYDDIQNGWKRWTLAIRPAYHTRNMVGNYLNAFMISGVRHAGRYVDAGDLQKKAAQGTLDDTGSMSGLGTKDTYGGVTEKELFDAIDERGGIGGQYSVDIQRRAELDYEGIAKHGNSAKRLLYGDVAPVRKAFGAGGHLENNARIGVFLDTLSKARKNPSKYQWYDPRTGHTLNVTNARNSLFRKRTQQVRDLKKYAKQIETGKTPKGKLLTPEELALIHSRKSRLEATIKRQYLQKVGPLEEGVDGIKKFPSTADMLKEINVKEVKNLYYDVAAMEMKKSLFDYSDLSMFERSALKRVIPFYTWSRKNIPAQFQALVKNPQRAEKLQIAREQFEHQGGSPDDRDVGAMWSGTVPIFLGQENEGVRSFFSLLNYAPIADLERIGKPNEILKQMVSPIIKEPLSQIANYDFFRERKIKEYKGQKKDFLGVALPPKAWHALQLLVPLVELNRLNPGGVFGLKKPGDLTGDPEITPGWWGLGTSRETGPVDIGGLARTVRFFMGVRTYDLDLQRSREWNKKKFVRDLTTLKAKLKWAKKRREPRKAAEIEALINAILSGEVTNPLMTQ